MLKREKMLRKISFVYIYTYVSVTFVSKFTCHPQPCSEKIVILFVYVRISFVFQLYFVRMSFVFLSYFICISCKNFVHFSFVLLFVYIRISFVFHSYFVRMSFVFLSYFICISCKFSYIFRSDFYLHSFVYRS